MSEKGKVNKNMSLTGEGVMSADLSEVPHGEVCHMCAAHSDYHNVQAPCPPRPTCQFYQFLLPILFYSFHVLLYKNSILIF